MSEKNLKRHKSIKQALEFIAANPDGSVPEPINQPMYELIAQSLFQIANNPNPRVRGSMGRATRAQKIIMNRMVGLRRAGTHPAQIKAEEIEFLDLTQPGELPEGETHVRV